MGRRSVRRPRRPRTRAIVTLKLNVGRDHLLGPRGARLLESVDRSGSIADAARAAGMSYKSAWSYLTEMGRLLRKPVVASRRGGARGGGVSRLTGEGKALLREYSRLRARLDRALGGR